VKTVGDKVVTHWLAYLSMWTWLVGTSPMWKFGSKRWFSICFHSYRL